METVSGLHICNDLINCYIYTTAFATLFYVRRPQFFLSEFGRQRQYHFHKPAMPSNGESTPHKNLWCEEKTGGKTWQLCTAQSLTMNLTVPDERKLKAFNGQLGVFPFPDAPKSSEYIKAILCVGEVISIVLLSGCLLSCHIHTSTLSLQLVVAIIQICSGNKIQITITPKAAAGSMKSYCRNDFFSLFFNRQRISGLTWTKETAYSTLIHINNNMAPKFVCFSHKLTNFLEDLLGQFTRCQYFPRPRTYYAFSSGQWRVVVRHVSSQDKRGLDFMTRLDGRGNIFAALY